MAVDTEQFERQASAHDIGDGIGRAHFVEMHRLDGHLVDGGFGFAEPLEHGCGVLFGALREGGLLDHLQNVRQVAVGVGFLRSHVELGGGDAAALDALEGQHRAGFERGERIDDGGLIRAGIRQRAHQHIAADPGEGVQIAEQGHDLFIMEDIAPPDARDGRVCDVELAGVVEEIEDLGKSERRAFEVL